MYVENNADMEWPIIDTDQYDKIHQTGMGNVVTAEAVIKKLRPKEDKSSHTPQQAKLLGKQSSILNLHKAEVKEDHSKRITMEKIAAQLGKIVGLSGISIDSSGGGICLTFQTGQLMESVEKLWEGIPGVKRRIFLQNCIEISSECDDSVLEPMSRAINKVSQFSILKL